MKVQQMSFNRKRRAAKSRPIADIGQRIETLTGNARPGDVDAISRGEFVVVAQIDRRHCVLGTIATAATGG